jgi:hypothetical protein
MLTFTQLDFITHRINELERAVFHSYSKNVLNLNSAIIKTIKIDDNSYIWFLLDKPAQEITEFEKQFPVTLNYYKKEAPFYLNVFGMARIVIDPEELACAIIDNELKNGALNNKILLSVKIINANYYEKEPAMNKTWLAKFKKALTDLFLPGENFYYNHNLESDSHFA